MCILVSLHMLIMLIVMWYPCKFVPYYLSTMPIHHGRNNHYTLVHKDKHITLLPMAPNSIWEDDINKASKAKQEQNKSENQIVAKEFEQQMKANNKPSSVAFEIKLKSGCLLATKSDIDDLDFSNLFAMLLCAKRRYFHSRTCLPLCLLLSLTFCRISLTSFHKTCHRDYRLFEGLSIRLT